MSEQICPTCRGSGKIIPPAWICVECKRAMPENFFQYHALNMETQEKIKPLCAHCIRGDGACGNKFLGPPWKHFGPFPAASS